MEGPIEKAPTLVASLQIPTGRLSWLWLVVVTGSCSPSPTDTPSSVPETPDVRRPVTAKERQREREEKRKRRQERAKEREKQKKEKEKERKNMLTENDRNLLERWTKMVDRTQNKPTQNGSVVPPPQANATGHILPQAPSSNPLVPPASHVPPTTSSNTPAPADFLTFSDKGVPAMGPKLTLLPVGAELAPGQGASTNVVHFFPAQTAPFLVAASACQKAAPSKPECLLSVKYAPGQIFQAPYGVAALNAWGGVPQPENWTVAGQLPVSQPEMVPPGGPLPEQGVSYGPRPDIAQSMFLTEMGKSELPMQGLVREEARGPSQHQMASGLPRETVVPSEPPDINVVTQQLSKSQVTPVGGSFSWAREAVPVSSWSQLQTCCRPFRTVGGWVT